MEKKFCTYCMSPVPPGGSCPVCGLTEGAYRPSPHHLPPGTVLQDRYLVGRVLGEGGFGITYIGCDLRLEMKVAIKEYYPLDRSTRNAAVSLEVTGFMGLAARSFERGKQRFLDEARTMARLAKQQVIVGVRDHFEANNTAYIVMEYIEGTTFSELARQRGGRIPPEELFAILEPLFGALSIVHENGLLHRDIAPDNLMLENGRVRLLDFGCAREASQGNETLTITLKHGYAPLEQYQQKGQGPWTDIYALCATIYFCLTGKAPPPALDRIAQDELLRPGKLGVALPPWQEAALLKGLATAPHRRFRTVEELRAALYEAPVEPAPPPPPPPPDDEKKVLPDDEKGVSSNDENKIPVNDAPGTDDTGDGPVPPAPSPPRWLWPAAGAAAALAAAIWAGMALGGQNTLPVGTSGVTSLSGAASQLPAGPDAAFSWEDAVAFTGSSEEELRALLEDEDVAAVALPAGCELTVQAQDLELAKPLLVEQGACLRLFHSLTVAGGGLVRVEGILENNGLLRTANAGAVEIGSTGTLCGNCLFWMEREADLTVEEGGSASLGDEDFDQGGLQQHFLARSEEEIFADAVYVTSWKEFRAAVTRADSPAVVIDGDMELLLDGSWTCRVPLAISEGVTVTASAPEGMDVFAAGLLVDSIPLLVNHGVLDCSLTTGSWTTTVPSAATLLVNYGEVRGSLFLDAPGALVNYGEVTSRSAQVLQTDVYTTGLWTQQGEGDQNWMNFYERTVCNMGQFTIAGENWVNLANSTRFVNSGTLTVAGGGRLENQALLDNSGVLRLEAGAELANCGLFLPRGSSCAGALELDEAALFSHCGLVNWMDTGPQALACQVAEGGGRALALDPAGERRVADEAALREALADESCTLIRLEGDVALAGDVTLSKGLDTGEARLTVTDGDLTLEGEVAALTGSVDLSGGALALRDGATALLAALDNCAGLALENALLACDAPLALAESQTWLGQGSCLLALQGLELENSGLQEQDGMLRACGSFALKNSEVELGGGELLVYNADLLVDEGSSITSGEDAKVEFQYNHDQFSRRLAGELTLGGDSRISAAVTVSGALVNRGTLAFGGTLTVAGSLDNQGALVAAGGAQLVVAEGGRFTGSQPVAG
ncbi:MAG TPA: protein kinase [Candidatus Fournierella merdipullorum]|uniref:Protein kinase n=1 Tax=Candidatus Allofournierella merdipullorum TaxID=2838595 RepID=A0A9D2IYV9_9FIRM|nr:protein kinase [Candidatus Fournierella merdipullorum]